jgi:signal transduction histidine kinase
LSAESPELTTAYYASVSSQMVVSQDETGETPRQGGLDRAALGVLEVASSVLGELDVERVLERVLEAARDLTQARYAAIGVLNESRTELSQFITAGVDEATGRQIGQPPTGYGVLHELINSPVPVRLGRGGRHPGSDGLPSGNSAMGSFLGVQVVVAGEPFGNLYLTDKHGGGQFTDLDQEALVRLAEFAGVAIDHARRYSGSQARRDEVQRSVDALGVMVEISRALGGQTDLARILELVAKRARILVSARTLTIELRMNRGLEVVAVAGELPANLIGQRIALEGSLSDGALRTGRTQRLADEPNRARFSKDGLGRLGFDAKSGLVVPLVFRGRSFGVLVALDRLARRRDDGTLQFTAQDELLLEALATSAAAAVATGQPAAAEQRRQRLAAAEQERARWGRELHDETLQGLASIQLGLSAARRAGGAATLDKAVGAAIGQLNSGISGLRALIAELRPPTLDQLGSKAAIEALAELADRNGLSIDVYVDVAFDSGREDRSHASELEITVYRIVQEALTNAVKNGRASHGVVEVVESETAIEVTVRDDGAGFDPAVRTEGFGVLGMRERVELLRGTLEIESAPGKGTVVRATLPVQRQTGPETPSS